MDNENIDRSTGSTGSAAAGGVPETPAPPAAVATQMTEAEATAAAATEAARKRYVIKIGGKTIDLREGLPMSVGDWKKLKKSGVDIMRLRSESLELDHVTAILGVVVAKVDSSVTAEAIDDLPLKRMATLALLCANYDEGDLDIPT